MMGTGGDVCVTQDVLPGSTVTHARARKESLDDGTGILIMNNRSAVHSLWRVAHDGLARPDCLLGRKRPSGRAHVEALIAEAPQTQNRT
jgi:hypothetical protein